MVTHACEASALFVVGGKRYRLGRAWGLRWVDPSSADMCAVSVA